MQKNRAFLFSFLKTATGRVLFFALLSALVVTLLPVEIRAQTSAAVENVQQVGDTAGLAGGSDLITIIGRIINIFLGFLGLIFLVLMLYAGYLWMTAAGDPEKVKKAQATIRNSIIGLVIIASAWAITAYILGIFGGEGFGGIGSGGTGGPMSQFSSAPGSSCLGKGIIETHLPDRNAGDVPRNSPIILTFKEPMKPETIMKDWTEATSNTQILWPLNDDNVLIYRTAQGEDAALGSDKIKVAYTKDLKTFVFKPQEYLGSPSEQIGYTVVLIGDRNGILKFDGSPALSCSPNNRYSWQFEVSTVLDLTPPYVTAVVPPAEGLYARNIVVQLNFNKAMDPTAAQGTTAEDFQNIEVLATPSGSTTPVPVTGEFKISNQYKTVEFVSDAKCGTNSCGRDVFCLPGNAQIQVNAKAATLDGPGPQAVFTTNGYDGLVSVVGNSLDGNHGDTAEGPPTDNYIWSFGTSNDIKLAPPVIQKTTPDANPTLGTNSNVSLDLPVTALFDSFLQSSTLNSENIYVDAHGTTELPDTFWWVVNMKMVKADGSDIDTNVTPPEIPEAALVTIGHRPFMPSGTFPNLNYYDPYITSGVQDAYQNCFNPGRKCGHGIGSNCCKYQPGSAECKTILNP
ncbi:MAG: pilin [Patescibacteria group bacterium]|nr:pilin [Patescibacteria group bacterium]